MRKSLGVEVEFITILLWNSIEDLRAAAGHDDYETAKLADVGIRGLCYII